MTAPVCAKPRVTETEEFPLEERIRLRAYELYVPRRNESEFQDWLQAEEEIQSAEEQKRRQTG